MSKSESTTPGDDDSLRQSDASKADGVPKAVVNRLSLYLRELQRLLGEDKKAKKGK